MRRREFVTLLGGARLPPCTCYRHHRGYGRWSNEAPIRESGSDFLFSGHSVLRLLNEVISASFKESSAPTGKSRCRLRIA